MDSPRTPHPANGHASAFKMPKVEALETSERLYCLGLSDRALPSAVV
ncbi:MAG: hypothetical protein RBJ76_28910 [Stenomitos frigidus ULC029]